MMVGVHEILADVQGRTVSFREEIAGLRGELLNFQGVACSFLKNISSSCRQVFYVIYANIWNPNDPCFGLKRPSFEGVDLQK